MRFVFCFLILCVQVLFANAPQAPTVVVERVVKKTLAKTSNHLGRLAFVITDVSSDVEGLVQTELIQNGAKVRKGQVLVKLDTALISQELNQINAEIKKSRIQLEKNNKDLKRFKNLLKGEAATEQEYEQYWYQNKIINAEIAALKAKAAKIKIEIEKSSVKAPFDGIIIERKTEQGKWISKGSSVCRLASINEVFAEIPVPESYVKHVKEGMLVSVKLSPIDMVSKGVVREFIFESDLTTKQFYVRIQVPYVEGMLNNMTVEADVPASQPLSLKMFKRSALVNFHGKDFIYLAKEGKASLVPIKIAAFYEEFCATDSNAVQESDFVIVDGNERLAPNTPINTTQKKR